MPYEDTDWTTADDTAKDTAKRFFADSAGAHVTSADSDATTGANALLDNSDLHFRDGTTDVARFGANGSQLGRDDDAHLVMDANSMELYDENDSQFFFAGDRRDVTSGVAEVMDSFYVNSSNFFPLSTSVDSVNYVKVDDVETTEYTITQTQDNTYVLSLDNTFLSGTFIEISYNTTERVLAFSLGGDASGNNSVAESGSSSYGVGSHSEGVQSSARGRSSHAEGQATETTGLGSHSEGVETRATAEAAHAEGKNTLASGTAAHAEGEDTIATGWAAHAEGRGTFAGSVFQHVFGRYNEPELNGAYAEIIGNGSANNARSNARTLDWNGNEELQGELYLGGCTANGETPYPAPRYNTLTSNLEYWDGTAWQTIPIASTGPKVYAGSVVKTASGTNCQLWTKAAFESTFHTTNAQLCSVMISNGDAGSLSAVVSAEYWSSGSNPGWFAKWTNSVGSGGRRFNYIVVVPEDVQA